MSAELPAGPLAVADATFFTRGRIERILGLVIGIGCAVLGVQAFLNALTSHQEAPLWRIVLMLVTFSPLALMVVAGISGILMRVFSGLFALVFPLVLVAWPIATAGRGEFADGEPWIWYLINVATVATALAFPLTVQYIWAGGVPLLYGVVRVLQLGGGTEVIVETARQVVFAIILAVVMNLVGFILRRLAADLDHARADAVQSYAVAASADAVEQERVTVAALMHDSVLAALIAAERARSPREEDLAVAMAREALTRLANADRDAEEGPDDPVEPSFIVDGLVAAAHEHGVDLPVTSPRTDGSGPLPGRVARALVLAGAQAVVNAIEHADAAGLRAEVIVDQRRVLVRITDDGAGFDAATVGEDRLGIRGSIVARIAAVGGHARVRSSPDGTVVELRWERNR
ncbi:sensor histidine kinase [Microbacterium dauci]|uniref:ATP-binding protein n=1 Tax=Microbacterium dauci TaxID=3048008 RepID=A0ABT6ZB64_9MICO|nr:ATP-binding protein [Microbacterium sp. LX3-4]MDJ1112920.1 ATP-binding protein [Microbacterium sp. LX3-4]